MGGIVHYLMATSFVFLVMISHNSPSCQACIGSWCRPVHCFKPTNNDYCTDEICPHVCELNGYKTNRAYCEKPKKGSHRRFCCCPPPR
ncbi:hypothetical protein SETIT_8G224000v2 [Setaria italica]|uniref:Bowman-Birk serine protease inhibitors family domain-containing protein n=1 Tax=Setaria italica TaxID=4555 RepID=A0A368SC71_SETIT|nr:hypothetical protein SETIT_8G224000v2 [Setaria italica]